MKLSIIVPVKDDESRLRDCLQSIRLAASACISYEVIVVDNGSVDDSVKTAIQFDAIVVVAPDLNVGALRNAGAQRASGDVLAFIDADCTVDSGWFSSIACYLENPEAVCFGAPPVIPNNSTWVQESWFQVRRKRFYQRAVFEVEWLESMNLFIRRDAFLRLGGFDETMVTCEDYDLCMRLDDSITCDTRIVAVHHGEAETVVGFYRKERWRGVSNLQSLKKHGFNLSELPSVLFPLVYLLICLIGAVASLMLITGSMPPVIWLLGFTLWQLPLLMLAFKKNGQPLPIRRVGGIWILLNVYFFARGLSLFSNAAWSRLQTGTGHVVAI